MSVEIVRISWPSLNATFPRKHLGFTAFTPKLFFILFYALLTCPRYLLSKRYYQRGTGRRWEGLWDEILHLSLTNCVNLDKALKSPYCYRKILTPVLLTSCPQDEGAHLWQCSANGIIIISHILLCIRATGTRVSASYQMEDSWWEQGRVSVSFHSAAPCTGRCWVSVGSIKLNCSLEAPPNSMLSNFLSLCT